MATFNEKDHPREEDGKFAPKGEGKTSAKDKFMSSVEKHGLDTQKQANSPDKLAKQMKNNKNFERKDRYGNSLVSDEAFKIGVEAVKKYINDQEKYGLNHQKLKGSNVYLSALQEEISDALQEAEMNPDYDLTYQDFNEIVGAAIGEEVDYEEYEGNATKGFTGKKYTGYKPKDLN